MDEMEAQELKMEKEQELMHQISDLRLELGSDFSKIGDWKVIKCHEASLAHKEMPYDLEDLLEKRQAVRDKINELEAELAAL